MPNASIRRASARQIKKPKCDPETPFGQLVNELMDFEVYVREFRPIVGVWALSQNATCDCANIARMEPAVVRKLHKNTAQFVRRIQPHGDFTFLRLVKSMSL